MAAFLFTWASCKMLKSDMLCPLAQQCQGYKASIEKYCKMPSGSFLDEHVKSSPISSPLNNANLAPTEKAGFSKSSLLTDGHFSS